MGRYYWLDVLRGALATGIVVIHACAFNGFFLDRGQIIVNTFIVLSGFVITMSLDCRPEPYGIYIKRRALRLFPVWWACLALSVLLWPFYNPASPAATSFSNFWPQLFIHIPLLQGLVPRFILPNSSLALLSTGWFVSLVWQYYLVAPFIIRFNRYWLVLGVSLLVLLPPIHWRGFIYASEVGAFLPQKLYLFVLGTLLWCYWPKLGSWGRAPSSLVFLGKISYPLYLVHVPLQEALNPRLPGFGHHWIQAGLLFVLSFPLSIWAAYLLHRWIENPVLRAGKAKRMGILLHKHADH
jgi:peptidoglycan/LPS O-acetylase OafA/YrhL